MAYKWTTNVSGARKKMKDREQKSGKKVCGRQYGKKCLDCEKVSKLFQSDDENLKKIAAQCVAKSTFYMNIVDLEDRAAGNQIYGGGIENLRTLVELLPESEDDDEGVDFTNPDSARAVFIKRRGKGLGTKYTIKLGTKALKIPEKWIKGMYNLGEVVDLIEDEEVEIWTPSQGMNKLLILPPWGKSAGGDFFYEVLYHWRTYLLDAAISGDSEEEYDSDLDADEDSVDEDSDGSEEDDVDEDEDETPKKKKSSKSKKAGGKKRSKDEDDDEDDDDIPY